MSISAQTDLSGDFDTFLAADIGGTNTRMLLFGLSRCDPCLSLSALSTGKRAPGFLLHSEKYLNQEHRSFADIARVFLKAAGQTRAPLCGCLAVAGPVQDNRVLLTNRDGWIIDGAELAVQLGMLKVRLINDFLGVGYGLLTLNEETECEILQKADKKPDCPIACIGAGTGLGQCFLTPDQFTGAYQCFPTEGGHSEFAPRDELEFGLLQFLKAKFEQKHRVSVERVVSGSGLANIYEYLCCVYPSRIVAAVQAEVTAAGDLKGKVIADKYDVDELCRMTMDIFIRAFGAEAGVAGLKWLPYGGLYLTGGLTPKNMNLIRDPSKGFMKSFLDKGRVSGMLHTVPVFAVLVEDLGERGAHYVAFKDFQTILGNDRSTHITSIADSVAVDSGNSQESEAKLTKKADELCSPKCHSCGDRGSICMNRDCVMYDQ